MFDTAIYIGRFQPWHLGHQQVYMAAARIARKVRILVGVAGQQDARNPYSYRERETVIHRCVNTEYTGIFSLRDRDDDTEWQKSVHLIAGHGDIVLVGHRRDSTSKYMDWFPEWAVLDIPDKLKIHGTHIRRAVSEGNMSRVKEEVPYHTFQFLMRRHTCPK